MKIVCVCGGGGGVKKKGAFFIPKNEINKRAKALAEICKAKMLTQILFSGKSSLPRNNFVLSQMWLENRATGCFCAKKWPNGSTKTDPKCGQTRISSNLRQDIFL
jgi:hypothetical protein